ncbi:MAG TPA: endospore germination permease [Bacilli bacterium]|nr:endospore germination permease [Bacilli bacterium]
MKKINISNYNTLLFFILKSCFFGIAGSNLYLLSKQDGWLSIIIGFLTGFLLLYLYYLIIKKYPDKNIIEIIELNSSKTVSLIIKVIYVILLFVFATSVFYNLINFINTQFLYRTPNLAIAIMFGICLYYLLHKGIIAICRTSTILFYIYILLYLSVVIGLLPQTDLTNFLPIFKTNIGSLLLGTFNIIFLNISPLFLLTIIPYNTISKKEKLIKNVLIFYTLGFFAIFTVNFFVTSIYGSNLARIIQYPEFYLLKRLSLIGFIERVEKVLFIQWIFSLVLVIVLSLYFIKKILIKKKENNTFIDFLLIIFLIFFVLYIFKNNALANNFYLYVLPFLCLFIFIIIPIFIYIKTKKHTNY